MLGQTTNNVDFSSSKTIMPAGKEFDEDDLSVLMGFSSESENEERHILPFTHRRHTDIIEGLHIETHAWRLKERVKKFLNCLKFILNFFQIGVMS